jgi:hypothetical protein
VGCANPGPPRPPSLQLPAQVSDLAAERIGDRVLLRWTTPARTTDDLEIKGRLSAELCRSVGPPSANPKKDQASCTEVERLAVAPGASSVWDDLPHSLVAAPDTLLTYRVEVFNAAGHSAGRSTAAAYTSAGLAPPPVESLRATASEAGSVLEWKRSTGPAGMMVELTRLDLSAPAAPARKPATAAPPPIRRAKSAPTPKAVPDAPNEVHLQAPEGLAEGLAGTVDTTATMGETYSYVAERVRPLTLAGHALELRSQPSPAVTLTLRDTFPPKSPVGLATIPGSAPELAAASGGTPAILYIDLSWEPNTEPDLAGYLVYRQLAGPNGDPQGPIGRLTPSPIAAPAYRDVAVRPGQRYIYSITAVDASGNESAPSAKAQETAEPQNVVGSPQ